MGLIYDAGESMLFQTTLRNNLDVSIQIFDQMKKGADHLDRSLGEGTHLDGAAYTAGQGYFREIVRPLIDKGDQTIQALLKDLDSYQASENGVYHYGHLDEDLLKQQIRLKENQIRLCNAQIEAGRNSTPPMDTAQLEITVTVFQNEIETMKERLRALYAFDKAIAGLFESGLKDLQDLQRAAEAMGRMGLDPGTGNYSLEGVDMSWAKGLNLKGIEGIKPMDGVKLTKEGILAAAAKGVISPETASKLMEKIGNKYTVDGIRKGALQYSEQNLSRMAKSGKDLVKLGEDVKYVAKAAKGLGALAIGIGAVFDYQDQMAKYHDQGRAIKNTVAHAALETGGMAIGASIGSVIPVAGTIAGAAIGGIIGYGLDTAYDWIETGQAAKDINNMEKGASKIVTNAVAGMAETVQGIGDTFAAFGNSLGSAFGW